MSPARAASIGVVALLLALGTACEHDERPFENQIWGGTCSSMPYGFQAYFEEDVAPDARGNRQQYLGVVNIPVVSSDPYSNDVYLWHLFIKESGYAETYGWQHTPFPEDFAEYYAMEELELSAETFQDMGTQAQVTGACSWGGEDGDFTMNQYDDCDACIDCAHVTPRVGGWALLAWSVLAGVRRRRAPA